MTHFIKQLNEALDTTPIDMDTKLGELDPMLTFRKIIYGLNNAGYITHASCQGHSGGGKWGGPYMVIKGPKQKRLARVFAKSGLASRIHTSHSVYWGEDMTDIHFPQNVKWTQVYKYLQQAL